MSPQKRIKRTAEFWNSTRSRKIPNLTAMEFYSKNFSKFNLLKAILDRVIFVNCIFNATSFQGARLCGAMFIRCVFKNTDFSDTDLYVAEFRNCIFETVNFKNVNTSEFDIQIKSIG